MRKVVVILAHPFAGCSVGLNCKKVLQKATIYGKLTGNED